MPEPHLRAADSDRAAVATVLGEHMSAGRLTVDEYDERLARTYAAKTYGDLAELTADLPTSSPRHRPTAAPAPGRAGSACGRAGGPWGEDLQSSWRAWATTAMIVLTIWAVTSLSAWELNYFWPIWVIGPWGAVLLARTVGQGSSRRGTRGEREQHRLRG